MSLSSIFGRGLGLFVCALAIAACSSSSSDDGAGSSSDETIKIGASSSNLSVQPMMDPDGNLLTPVGLKGTYGPKCKVHAGQSWDLKLNDPSDRSLEVALNDTFANCPLTVTAIQTKLGPLVIDSVLANPITLGVTYGDPSKVNFDHTPFFIFYANAKMNGLASNKYTNDFTINLVYSDDSEVCKQVAPPAVYAKVTATATGAAVPPPDYTMGFDSLKLVVDADGVVQGSSSGNVVLQGHIQPGEEWKVYEDSAWCCGMQSFASIDAIYKGKPLASGTMSSGDVNLPWSNFALDGKKLPTSKMVIVKHMGDGGVYSYELFQVLFPGASK